MFAAPLGVPRLYFKNQDPEQRALMSSVKHQYTLISESNMFIESMQTLEMLDRVRKQIPLVVVSRNSSSSSLMQNNAPEHQIEWAKLQEELALLSEPSSLIFSKDSRHAIHRMQPQLVISAIEEILADLKTTL
jgi:hypothetical protein